MQSRGIVGVLTFIMAVYEIMIYMFLHICMSSINLLFLTFDNEFSGIMYSLFGGRQNNFLIIFGTKFVLKCPAKILRIS